MHHAGAGSSPRRFDHGIRTIRASVSVGSISAKGRRAGQSRWVERLGRAGLVAKGVLYAVIGILAVKVALGARGEDPDKEGALRTIAAQPFGTFLLGVLAVGLAGYAAWRLAQGLLRPRQRGRRRQGSREARRRARQGRPRTARCACSRSTKIAGASGGESNQDKTTAGVLGLPLGRYLVFAVAAGFVCAALFNGYRAITCKFEKSLETERMSEAEETAARGVGVLGHLARFVVFALIGAFLAQAALGVPAEGGRRTRRRAAEGRAAGLRSLAPRRRRRRTARVRALLLRAGSLPRRLTAPCVVSTQGSRSARLRGSVRARSRAHAAAPSAAARRGEQRSVQGDLVLFQH